MLLELFGFVWLIYLISNLLQISAEEIKDNRVANFEAEARKLDNKVRVTITEILKVAVDCYIQVHFTYRYDSFTGFLWEVRPLLGILQAD